LATLRSSANPDKALAKAQLGEIRTVKKYPIDFRQYSFNGEVSYDFDSLGVGESLESNVIYSQKSYLPRSVSLNLTSEIFGHRYNFLEIDTRQENLDTLVGSYFGPSGYFRTKGAQGLFKEGSNGFKNLYKKVEDQVRSRNKREVNKNQLEHFSRQLQVKESALNKDFDLDLSVKLFGSEYLFLSLNEDIQKFTPESIVDSFFKVVDEISKQPDEFDKTITSNMIFLDSEVAYPTSTGFPLRLSVEGTASVQLKASGKNLYKFIFDDGDRDYKLTLIPSVNAQIASRIVVDAALVESGLKVVGNLYSSVGSSVELSVKSNSFDYKLTLPLDKQEILTVTHDIVFETRELCGQETETPLKFIQSKDFQVCLDQLKSYIGLTFCADLNQPNVGEASTNILPYPLNGNSKFSVSILKNDFGYLHYRGDILASGVEGILEIIDVHNRPKASFKYDLNLAPPLISFELISPDANAKFEARFIQSSTEYYGLVRLSVNNLEYYVKLGAQYASSDTQLVITPIMEYKAGQSNPQKTPYHVTGQIIVQELSQSGGARYMFNQVKLVSPDRPAIDVSGEIARQSGELSSDITLNDGIYKGTLKGKIQFLPEGLIINAQFDNTFNPTSNFDLKYNLKYKNPVNMESSLQLIHGPDLSSKNALLKLSNSISYDDKGDDSVFTTEHEISYPGLGLDDKFKLKLAKKAMDLELRIGYNEIKVGTELEIVLDKKSPGDLDVEFELYGFDNKLEIDLERAVNGYKSNVHHKITLNGNSIDVKGEIKHLLEQHRADIAHNLVIKITSRPDIAWKSALSYTQTDIDTSINVKCGEDVVIDAFLKASTGGDANGNLKFNIPRHISASGNIKSSKGVGTLNLLVDFLGIDRKLKTEGTFTSADPTYNLDIILYSDYEKDNTRKYRLLTNNQFKSGSLLESKNVLHIIDHETVLNFKLSHGGDINDFEQAAEVEFILPTEQYFAGKANRKLKNDKGVLNGQGQLTLEQRPNKNAAGNRVTLKGVLKDLKPNEGIFDLSYTLTFDNGGGKALTGELNLKKSKSGDVNNIDYNGKLYGSALPEPLAGNLVATCKEISADYKFSTSYGTSATLNIKGKYDYKGSDSKEPHSGELHIDVQTPNSVIKVIKYDVEGSVVIPQSDADNLVVKGSTALFVDDDGKQPGATLNLKYDLDWDFGYLKGRSREKYTIQENDFTVTVDYDYEPNKKLHAGVGISYSNDKHIKTTINLSAPNNETLVYDLYLETPVEKAKTVQLQGQIIGSNNLFNAESSLTVNGQKYSGKALFDSNEAHPSYDVELFYPTGKSDRLYFKLLKYDSTSISGETKIVLHMYDFTLNSNFDAVYKSSEDFSLKLYLDCPKLNVDKVEVNANTKAVKDAKKLIVNAKKSGKKFIDGSTTFKVQKQDGKIIIDGSGTLTINNEKKRGTFKVTYKELSQKRDKEQGIELTISSNVGSKAFDIEYILTVDHFKYLTSYCVEKQECAHFEIEQTQQADLHTLQINVDLRPLGVSHEFGLKSETQIKQLKQSLDVHLVSNQKKYQYNSLILPTESHFTLTTPNRIVSLESEVNSPTAGEPLKGKSVLYLNKLTKPDEKSTLNSKWRLERVKKVTSM